MNKLAENKHGTGAHIPSKIRIKIRRLFRSRHNKHKNVGSASLINWNRQYVAPSTKIKDQGISSSCGGQATSYFLEKLYGQEISAKSIYSRGYASVGGMVDSVLRKVIQNMGANIEKDVPSYDAYGNPLPEILYTDNSWQSTIINQDALSRSGMVPINVSIDMDSIAKAIDDYGGVIFLITGQNNGTWTSPYPKPPSINNPNPRWGHYMDSFFYSMGNEEQIDCFQSWGNNVGDNGVQHFTKEYINSGFIVDAFSFTKKLLFTTQMGFGSIGKSVYDLQNKLISEGVSTFKAPTGIFWYQTEISVKNYQKKYNIQQTGYVGPLTLAQLNKS